MSPRPKKNIPAIVERTKLKNIALFKNEDEPTEPTLPSQTLPFSNIVLPPSQPRRYFASDKLEQLTRSIEKHGVLEPLLVRLLSDSKYELVAGERRYRAAKAAGLTEIPVVIKQLTNLEALQLSLVENLQREDLNPVDETEGILQLIALQEKITVEEVISLLYRMYNEVKGNVDSANPNVRVNELTDSVKSVFDSVGNQTWESFVKNKLPLLKLPSEVLEVLRQGKLEYTKAKAIAQIKDELVRSQILAETINKSLSLSQIKDIIRLAKPIQEKEELKSRFENTYLIAKKSKQLWQDPKKRKKLQVLLSQLEKLIEEEDATVVNKTTLAPIFSSLDTDNKNSKLEETNL